MLNNLLQIVQHDPPKAPSKDPLKVPSKRVIQKTSEATGDLIGNKISDKVTRGWKTSPRNNAETNEEMPKEKYVSRIKIKNQLIT